MFGSVPYITESRLRDAPYLPEGSLEWGVGQLFEFTKGQEWRTRRAFKRCSTSRRGLKKPEQEEEEEEGEEAEEDC